MEINEHVLCQLVVSSFVRFFFNYISRRLHLQHPGLLSQASHGTCSLSCFRSGSSFVLHPTSFIAFSVPIYYNTFAAHPFTSKPAHPFCPMHIISQGMHQPFAKASYNTHWVKFRSTMSFIYFSRVQYTRCLLFFELLAAPLRLHSPCGCFTGFKEESVNGFLST